MLATLRTRLALGLGVVMVVLAAVILVSTLVMRRPPVTGSVAFDVLFAAFFLLRGYLNVRRGRLGGAIAPAGENPGRTEG